MVPLEFCKQDMRLYLLRHAQAEEGIPDAKRALTRRGLRDVEKLGQLLKNRHGFKPKEIWHSPFTRAAQTAQLLATELNFDGALEVREGLTPFDDPDLWVERCHHLDTSIIIVGHNPHLAMLAGRLLGNTTFSVSIEFKKCGMLCLERHRPFAEDYPANWSLRWMLVPQLLR